MIENSQVVQFDNEMLEQDRQHERWVNETEARRAALESNEIAEIIGIALEVYGGGSLVKQVPCTHRIGHFNQYFDLERTIFNEYAEFFYKAALVSMRENDPIQTFKLLQMAMCKGLVEEAANWLGYDLDELEEQYGEEIWPLMLKELEQ